MTPEQHQQVDRLLPAVLEKPVAERMAYLEQACGEDAELLAELKARLAACHPTADLPEAPTAVLTAELLDQNTGELLRGRMLGRYELQSALGRGGMGTVFQALDTQLGRGVALKLLPRRFTSDAERVRRFRQEARAISALNHPNILTIHEIGEAPLAEGEVHYLATELVEGQTLRVCLNDRGLTLGEALDIAAQTAGALAAAHQAGIIHRDIKPENLMVRPDGLVKVLDFGLAKLTGQQTRTSRAAATYSTIHTNPGVVMGTISYMSPEQARGLEVDARSDIFSLGVVLYEMLTGRAPFAGATSGDVLVSILDREPPPLARLWPQAPPALQRILTRALAKDCAERYQQVAELQDELKELKQELEMAARLKREGQTPVNGTVSLSLRLGQYTDAAKGEAGQGAVLTTQAVARPTDKSRRLLARLFRPGTRLLLAALLLVLLVTIAILSRRWFAPTADALNTIAVLPFVNQSADPQLDYLSDGLTESLMQSLQQLPGTRVMARGTVFTYKGREVDPRQVGQALDVRSVVTGRMQRLGEQLIISVELADARDGTQLWSARYQRPLVELVAMQTELSRALSARLLPGNTSAQKQSNGRYSYTANAEAYRLYLQGRYHFNLATYEEGLKALDYFQQAIALDPAYALAYAGVADIYADFSSRYRPPSEVMPKAREAAAKALALDDKLAEAHHSMAIIKCWGDWDWAGAEQEFKLALQLNPNLAMTHALYSNTLSYQRRFEEALREARQAQTLDPLSTIATHVVVWNLYDQRRYDEAIQESARLLKIDPSYYRTYDYLGYIYRQKGQLREAIAEVQKGLALQRRDQLVATLAYLYAVSGQQVEARRLLAELEQKARQSWIHPVLFAKIHIGLGEHEQAMGRLQEAYAAHSEFLFNLSVDPVFDPLRTDARFTALVRSVGLQP